MTDSKVSASHRANGRLAVVYVRQSTVAQTQVNTESLRRQYELVCRATGLGWDPSSVRVIDEDLGRSAADAVARSGFQSLVADVGLGKVGLVLGIEVSRLARRNADWYHLLDLCALTATLIGDADGIYDPADYSDRLVLGLKGTMSEAELHLLRGRLTAGARHKAARGELRLALPAGYSYDPDGTVVLSADEAVREAVATVFRRFDELGSARQVLVSLLGDGLELPRHRPKGRVEWTPATHGAVHAMLTNPTYAGVYAFGRTRTGRRLDDQGRVVVSKAPVGEDSWAVAIHDHHPAYISWETYQANQGRLAANNAAPKGEGGGAAREGTALLQGILRCGVCGRMMRVGYSGRAAPAGSASPGVSSRYICLSAEAFSTGGVRCNDVGGRQIEAAVLTEVFAVLEPAALAATAKALNEAEACRAGRLRVFEATVERTRYDAERARRQYEACEPENRLVARSLETAWEARLSAVKQAEAALATEGARAPAVLSGDELAFLNVAGADLRAVFEAPTTTARERKQLLRALLVEVGVTIERAARRADLTLHWEGGATSEVHVPLPRLGAPWRTTDTSSVDLVRRLAVLHDDDTIAQVLGRQHRRTGSGLPYTKARVAELRKHHHIPIGPTKVTPPCDDAMVVSVSKAAAELRVGIGTIYRWLADGFIAGEQPTPGAPWQIRLDDALRSKVAEEAPDGWLGLDQAAKALGVARQTVLNKVQRGELAAVHVRRGRRSGLRVQVKPDQVGLFAQP
ncbi:MAG: recombinase family protein [Actinomycetota bacterium]|nr:recombinase family protein [Actinomycetota bacterium]